MGYANGLFGLDAQTIAIVCAAFVLAGLVKGVVGLGLPTVAIGVLSLIMAPAQAAAVLVVPSLVTNVWQLAAGPRLSSLLRRLFTMLLGVCVGVWAGAGLMTPENARNASMGLGVALVLYALLGLSPVRIRVPGGAEPWLSPVIGFATGLVTAATGIFVLPAVPYLAALALDRDELVQALGISFTVSTLALAAVLVAHGTLDTSVGGVSLFALAPALVGMWIGQRVRSRIRAETFRRWFFIGLLALGTHLTMRGLL